ncbi:hypothetical protein [Williamsoniiplasma luminosum]|nr:hypothetical protein [Williamsoniiplasma luminosum]
MNVKVGEIYKGWSEAPGDYHKETGEYKFGRLLIIEQTYPKEKWF